MILLYLLLLFICIPLIELALLLYLASVTSIWATLALVVVTGVIGASLARHQGWQTYARIQQELAARRMPTESLLDAAMIFVAGALLLTPGLLTDLFGFSLLVPGCRRFYRHSASRWIRSRFRVQPFPPRDFGPRDQIIEARVDDPPGQPGGDDRSDRHDPSDRAW